MQCLCVKLVPRVLNALFVCQWLGRMAAASQKIMGGSLMFYGFVGTLQMDDTFHPWFCNGVSNVTITQPSLLHAKAELVRSDHC